MTTFVLVPGAGGDGWYWHRLVPELERRGCAAVAVDLPAADDTAGLAEYADALAAEALAAAGDRGSVTLVAHSMGALTAPLVCHRVPVDLLVLFNAMVPRPGETGAEWWTATGQQAAAAALAERFGIVHDPDDLTSVFLHDVPPGVAAAVRARPFEQSGRPFAEPWPMTRWPDVPTRLLAARDDRLFPAEFQRRSALERLGVAADELPGGHLVALSRPAELAHRLVGYLSS